MAQKNATPTKEQGEIIERNGLNKAHWVVVKELSKKLIITNRFTHEFRTIDKATDELRVADIQLPDPDGQFRLRGCSCGGLIVAYLKLEDGNWAVRCMRCKGSLDKWLDSLTGPPGPAGRSAYEYAKDGGYTGTEAEFTMQMARELNAVQVTEAMTGHMASKENPHSVTAAQIGAAESGHTHKTMDDHVVSKENPHGVTPQQIGAADATHDHKPADIKDVIPMTGGGTGAQNGTDGLKNLLAAGDMILSSHQYGDTLPADAPKGALFFLKVSD